MDQAEILELLQAQAREFREMSDAQARELRAMHAESLKAMAEANENLKAVMQAAFIMVRDAQRVGDSTAGVERARAKTRQSVSPQVVNFPHQQRAWTLQDEMRRMAAQQPPTSRRWARKIPTCC